VAIIAPLQLVYAVATIVHKPRR